jgi:hypothetical protein
MHQTSSNRNWKSPKYPCLALRGRETCSKHFLSCTDYWWIHQKNLIHLPTNWTWPRNHQFGVDCAAERQGSQTTWFIQLTNSKGFFGTNFTYGPFEYVQCSFSSSHDMTFFECPKLTGLKSSPQRWTKFDALWPRSIFERGFHTLPQEIVGSPKLSKILKK